MVATTFVNSGERLLQVTSPGASESRLKPLLTMLILATVTMGCASGPSVPLPIEDSSSPPVTIDAPIEPPQSVPEEPANPATLALRDRSAVAARDGDDRQAVALLERAIRIEPRNPALWSDLARVQVNAGNLARAEQSARKAIALATSGSRSRLDVERAAWLVIADVREAQNKPAEAARIRERWRSARG